MATKINMDRYVWEGWTVGAFIRELAPQVEMIMSGVVICLQISIFELLNTTLPTLPVAVLVL